MDRLTKLFNKVKQLRKLQRLYKVTRLPKHSEQAKYVASQVDELITLVDNEA